jgi:hypothetical protein
MNNLCSLHFSSIRETINSGGTLVSLPLNAHSLTDTPGVQVQVFLDRNRKLEDVTHHSASPPLLHMQKPKPRKVKDSDKVTQPGGHHSVLFLLS